MGILNRFKNITPPSKTTPAINNSDNPFHLSPRNDFSVHPDLIDLIWIGDGKYKNFQSHPNASKVYYCNGFSINMSSFGLDEPSLLYLELPIRKPSHPDIIERPPYYPFYSKLTPEQKWLYWRFLNDPYNPNNDIGYVFIFYYGLERHLLCGNFDKAFDIILKLRNIYGNKSFQKYSSSALILSAMLHKRADCAEKFIKSLNQEFEYQISSRLYLLCKFGLSIAITPSDIMRFHKDFHFTNNHYIKSNPDLFLKNLKNNITIATGNTEYIYASHYFTASDTCNIPAVRERIFANVSIMDKELIIPDVTHISKFTGTIYRILNKTHEDTKNELAISRKKAKKAQPAPQSTVTNTSKEILYTKWGAYIMPEPYAINFRKGPRTDLKSISSNDSVENFSTAQNDASAIFESCESASNTEYWSDEKYRQVVTRYYDEMNQIENSWSILYNLKDYSSSRAEKFALDCQNNIETLKLMVKIGKKYGDSIPPSIPAYKRLAMLYEKQELYEKAIAICIEALSINAYLDDSKGGMKGRLARMIRKANRQPTSQELQFLN